MAQGAPKHGSRHSGTGHPGPDHKDIHVARINMWQAVFVALISAGAGFGGTFLTISNGNSSSVCSSNEAELALLKEHFDHIKKTNEELTAAVLDAQKVLMAQAHAVSPIGEGLGSSGGLGSGRGGHAQPVPVNRVETNPAALAPSTAVIITPSENSSRVANSTATSSDAVNAISQDTPLGSIQGVIGSTRDSASQDVAVQEGVSQSPTIQTKPDGTMNGVLGSGTVIHHSQSDLVDRLPVDFSAASAVSVEAADVAASLAGRLTSKLEAVQEATKTYEAELLRLRPGSGE